MNKRALGELEIIRDDLSLTRTGIGTPPACILGIVGAEAGWTQSLIIQSHHDLEQTDTTARVEQESLCMGRRR